MGENNQTFGASLIRLPASAITDLHLTSFFRQPSSLGCLIWLAFSRLPHGRSWSKGLPFGLQCYEPFHRLDSAHGRQPSVAAVHRSIPPRPRCGHGDHYLSSLHPRNLPSGPKGCLRKFPPGEFTNTALHHKCIAF